MWQAILRPFFGGGSQGAAVLPRRGTTGTALGIVMTIMSYLACLAVWAGISIAAATHTWTSGIANTITVQIKPPEEGPVPQSQIDAALGILKKTRGVASANALGASDTSKLLQPWLGNVELGPELPISALINVKLTRRQDIDFGKLQSALSKAVPNATVDDHTRWTARILAVSRSLTAISLTVLALVLTAAMAIMVFATRAGLMTHAGIVEILHLTGAQGEFIAAEFERHFSRLGLRAGIVGLMLALATLLIIHFTTSGGGAAPAISLVPRLSLSPPALFGLLLVPIAAAIVATITARLTVLRALETMP